MLIEYFPQFEQPMPRKSGRTFVLKDGQRVELRSGVNEIDDAIASVLLEDSEIKMMIDWGALKPQTPPEAPPTTKKGRNTSSTIVSETPEG